METLACDVAVVGSGISGLTSALRLSQRGLTVVVIEAGDTIGGRTRSIQFDEEAKVSVGGTWAIFDDEHTLQLAHEVGCMPFTPELDTMAHPTKDMILHPYILFKLWLRGRKLSHDNPDYWNSSKAKKYDKISLQAWLDKQDGFLDTAGGKRAVLEWFALMENMPWDLSNLSLLFACVMVYQRLSNITMTGFLLPKTLRWEGGTGVFVQKIVDKLLATGLVQFRTQSPVRTIAQSGDGVTVGSDKTTVQARHVIVATSFQAAAAIGYQPDLPADARGLLTGQRIWNDPAVNIVLKFTRDWDPGLTVLPDLNTQPNDKGVFGPVMNLTPAQSAHAYFRILVDSRRVSGLTEAEIRESAIAYLNRFTPTPLRDLYVDMKIMDWTNEQPWIPAVTYYYNPDSTLTKFGQAMRRPHGRVHWGGGERSLRGLHWIEGAVRRGNEVAASVLSLRNRIKDEKVLIKEIDEKAEDVVESLKFSFAHLVRNAHIEKARGLTRQPGFKPTVYRVSDLTEAEQKIFREIHKEPAGCRCISIGK